MSNIDTESETCSTLDMVGATASMLCAIHCMPAIGLGFLLSQTLERGFVISAVIFALANTCWGFRIHRKTRVIWIAALGGTMLLFATFNHTHFHGTAPRAETVEHFEHGHDAVEDTHGHLQESRPQSSWQGLTLLLCGAAFLSSAHFLNRRFCKTCHHCHDHG